MPPLAPLLLAPDPRRHAVYVPVPPVSPRTGLQSLVAGGPDLHGRRAGGGSRVGLVGPPEGVRRGPSVAPLAMRDAAQEGTWRAPLGRRGDDEPPSIPSCAGVRTSRGGAGGGP